MADHTRLAEAFVDSMPHAAARAIEAHPPENASAFVDAIPDVLSTKALDSMRPALAAQCIERLERKSAAKYLRPLSAQDIAAIFRHLSDGTREQLLPELPRRLSLRINLILHYPQSAVGSWVDTSAPAVAQDARAIDALKALEAPDDTEHQTFYVVDANEHLLGRVTAAKLLTAEADTIVSQLMRPVEYRIAGSSSLDAGLAHAGWQQFDTLPVVDRADRLLGAITHAALRRATLGGSSRTALDSHSQDFLDTTGLWYGALATALDALLARQRS